MVRRIFAVLMALAVVFSLTIVSFADQTPIVYDFSGNYRVQTTTSSGNTFSDIGDIIFDFDNVSYYAFFPNPQIVDYLSDAAYSFTVSGYTDVGLDSFQVPFVEYPSPSGAVIHLFDSSYDPLTGYFSATFSGANARAWPSVRFSSQYMPDATFVSIRSCIGTVIDGDALLSSFDLIQALTANTSNRGVVTLSDLGPIDITRMLPIFSEPLEKGVTYLVSIVANASVGNGSNPEGTEEDIVNYVSIYDIALGSLNDVGAGIPFDLYLPSYGSSVDASSFPQMTYASFLFTPEDDSVSPFTFVLGSPVSKDNPFSAYVTVSAIPVVGVQLDDVNENQSFAAWLNNKLDSIFGGIAARLNGIFDKQNQAYEDAADDAVDAGLAEAEQDHAREEELTNQAITNLDQSLDAVELPDLTQQQEINSGIGLLNTVIFDGFFGNPQMRFLLIFSLGMALAAVVLRLNH